MKKPIIIILIVLVLALAAYFIFRKPKDEPAVNSDPGSGTGKTDTETPEKVIKSNPMPLKIGSGHIVGSEENTLVKDVQTALNTKHGAKLVVDGKFGAKTLAALIANGYGGQIYWKQYSQITGKALTTDQQDGNITGIFTADNAANWWSYLTTW